ncbi:hypothetical protein K431DRAFT_314552 [Polychaeton citri CBS 116435]|uniref:Uncharacterized protein n=1 Tax=Polychaeton citri CBS 116435 TaxID=1314669 RepID=A0A9P4Q3N2_9PEZI|nr:hypothetical protein K431DRAFT_314552 [Polychaeton citri CBS 116435]
MSVQTSNGDMPVNDAGSTPTRLPSPYDVALALAVVKTKPLELTVREYIMTLLPHCTGQKRWPQRFDRASYWRGEHERATTALNVAVGERDNFKRANETLKSQALDLSAPRPALKKRKKAKADGDATAFSTSPREEMDTCQTLDTAKLFLPFACDLDESLNVTSYGPTGNLIMGSLFQLHLQIHTPETFSATTYAYHLTRIASNTPKLSEQAQRHYLAPTDEIAEIDRSLSLLQIAFRTLVQGITRLTSEIEGGKCLGPVIHAYAQMYSDMLDQLQKAVPPEVLLPSNGGKARKASKPRKNPESVQTKTVFMKDTPAKTVISRCLCSIISLLDSKVDAHKDLFEAIAFVTIDRLGDRLFTLSFGHNRGSSIEDELIRSNGLKGVNAGVGTVSDPMAQFHEDKEFTGAKADAPYLVHLLRHLVAASPHFMGFSGRARSHAKGVTPVSRRRLGKGVLAEVARERLQRTLISCTFGTKGVEADDPIMQCLNPPQQLPDITLPRVKEADVHDWFKEEVWKLVGWDIITQQIGDDP